MKIAIITTITGGMDLLRPFSYPARYDAFDVELHTYGDADVPVEHRHLSPRTQALYFKMNMHEYLPDCDYYIWLDGKVQMDSDSFVKQCMNTMRGVDLAILKHGERFCVYQEVAYIQQKITNGNDYLTTRYGNSDLPGQAAYMMAQGYPTGAGLNDCSIFIVRNCPEMKALFSEWWLHCRYGRAFDQIWIRFLAWKKDVQIRNIEFTPGTYHLVKHNKLQ